MEEKLKRGGRYPLAEHKFKAENKGAYATPTGEFRPPKKGEWYLSGAIIEAWCASNDLQWEYWIARIVRSA